MMNFREITAAEARVLVMGMTVGDTQVMMVNGKALRFVAYWNERHNEQVVTIEEPNENLTGWNMFASLGMETACKIYLSDEK